MKLTLPLSALLLIAAPALAREPKLVLPLSCTLGQSCFIQQYVDADPGPGAADYQCGSLSYDGHSGTDFALPSMAAMEAGVKVRAAAPGVVAALRDGMPDLGRAGTPPDELEAKGCGNGVVVNHGGGWSTQYCHLKQGSIAVGKGDRVAMGTPLGLVGYSGNTEFPHVELTVRHNGKTLDPFNMDGFTGCQGGDDASDDLWATPLPYQPGGVIAVSIEAGLPEYEAVKSGAASHNTLPAAAPALVGWAYIYGGQKGDQVEITVIAPDGTELIRRTEVLEKTQAQLFRAAGKKQPAEGWTVGNWQVVAQLIRNGKQIDQRIGTVLVGG
ncbi:MAG: M23 family metallopeptidase [Maritimibacter sp.]